MNQKIVSIALVLGSTVVAMISTMIRFSSIGEGEHSGFITAVDQEGYIFRNYDVYFKTDNSSSQEDLYCINRKNTKLIEEAKTVNRERKQVTITYKGVRGLGYGLCEGSEIISISE